MGGGSDMESRVAGVDVMTNRQKEIGAWSLAARSNPKRTNRQARRFIKHSLDPDVITGGDRNEEREQCTIVDFVGSPICLRHGYRLPDLERLRTGRDLPSGGVAQSRLTCPRNVTV